MFLYICCVDDALTAAAAAAASAAAAAAAAAAAGCLWPLAAASVKMVGRVSLQRVPSSSPSNMTPAAAPARPPSTKPA